MKLKIFNSRCRTLINPDDHVSPIAPPSEMIEENLTMADYPIGTIGTWGPHVRKRLGLPNIFGKKFYSLFLPFHVL